jgi:hypothetical protein
MTVYTASEARQKLASRQKRRSGQVEYASNGGTRANFDIVAIRQRGSPLDVEGVLLDLTAEEIVSL